MRFEFYLKALSEINICLYSREAKGKRAVPLFSWLTDLLQSLDIRGNSIVLYCLHWQSLVGFSSSLAMLGLRLD